MSSVKNYPNFKKKIFQTLRNVCYTSLQHKGIFGMFYNSCYLTKTSRDHVHVILTVTSKLFNK